MMTSRPVVNGSELGHDLYHSAFESVINEKICTGTTKSFVIRNGITLLQTDLTFHQDTEVEMLSSQPQVGFCFCLRGQSTAYVENLYGKAGDFALHLADRTGFVYANSSSEGRQHFWENKPLQSLYIHFSYESFNELLGNSLADLPEDFAHALGNNQASYLYLGNLVQPVLSLCYSLYEIPFSGKSREFFIEAKVIELIAYQLDALSKPVTGSVMLSPPLTRAEEEKIDACYYDLERHLSNPPSILELARKYNISVYRLKNAFRFRYGDTPFKVLTELRMLKAKQLLEKGELNVSEVAIEVGYNSLGTFSNTFQERFGIRPGVLRP